MSIRQCDLLRRREDFGILLERNGLFGQAVEIGTHEGYFAEQLLHRWSGSCLHAIDPWITDLEDYHDTIEGDREPHYRKALERLTPFVKRGRCEIHRLLSEDAVLLFEDYSLDFVYIDGNHSEKHFKQDVALWMPKIRRGGILAGHDLTGRWGDNIRPTVEELSLLHDTRWVPGDAVRMYPPYGDCASFYMIKG